MNQAATSAQQPTYLFDRPVDGQPVEILDGIYWLRTSLPFALDHVNIWLLRGDNGWTVIDAGYSWNKTRTIWDELFAGFFGDLPLRRVIATHFHPDHVGLSGWLVERSGAEFVMSRSEWLTSRMLKLDDTAEFAELGEWHDRRAGLDEELIGLRKERGNSYRRGVVLAPGRVTLLRGGDTIEVMGQQWRVIIGEGHAPEMITLYNPERGLLISADQILPRISPVIGVWSSVPEADPLDDFDRSLNRYADLPEDCTVLPSHDGPFVGLHARVTQLRRHHDERLEKTLEVCAEPSTAAEVMPALFKRKLDIHNTGFALGETLAHINRLWRRGDIVRELCEDGRWRYRRN